MLKKFFGTRSFYKLVIVLAIPGMLQQIVTALANLIDNFMVGGLGADAISAVGIVNQIFFIYMLVLFGIASSSGIYISQFKGSNDVEGIKQSLRFALIISMIVGIFLFIVVNIFPNEIISLFTTDQGIVNVAVEYLHAVSYSYLVFPIVSTYSICFRSDGHPKLSMYSSLTAVGINTLLNYCLIYGNFGFSSLGVTGAAYATVIARLFEAALLIGFSGLMNTNIYTDITHIFRIKKQLAKDIIRTGKGLIANEFLWSLAIVAAAVFYTKRIDDNIAAWQIASTVVNLLFAASIGMGAAISVITGITLGEGNFKKAKQDSIYLMSFVAVIGLIFGIITFLLSFVVPYLNFFDVDDNVRVISMYVLWVYAIFSVLYYLNMALFMILRSGGDVKGVLIMDSGYMWLILMPLAVLLAFTDLSMPVRLFLVQLTELIKLAIAFRMYRQNKWVANLVENY